MQSLRLTTAAVVEGDAGAVQLEVRSTQSEGSNDGPDTTVTYSCTTTSRHQRLKFQAPATADAWTFSLNFNTTFAIENEANVVVGIRCTAAWVATVQGENEEEPSTVNREVSATGSVALREVPYARIGNWKFQGPPQGPDRLRRLSNDTAVAAPAASLDVLMSTTGNEYLTVYADPRAGLPAFRRGASEDSQYSLSITIGSVVVDEGSVYLAPDGSAVSFLLPPFDAVCNGTGCRGADAYQRVVVAQTTVTGDSTFTAVTACPSDCPANATGIYYAKSCEGFTTGPTCFLPDTAQQCAFGDTETCQACPEGAACPGMLRPSQADRCIGPSSLIVSCFPSFFCCLLECRWLPRVALPGVLDAV